MRLVDLAVGRGLDLPCAIVKLQYSHGAALRFNQPNVYDESRNPLLTSRSELTNTAWRELTHLLLKFIHWVSTEKTPKTLFLTSEHVT